MKVTCHTCPRVGLLGNTIRYEKVVENGKEKSIPLCNRCIQEIRTVRKPK